MNSKISNKPDQLLNSPLKPTSFPVDLSLFQMSQASSKNKKSASPTEAASIQVSSIKHSQARPNLFQYNERAPLLFSSDEEDNHEPHFNYSPERDDIRPVGQNITPFSVGINEKKEQKGHGIDEIPSDKGLSKENPGQFSIKELLSPQAPIKNNVEAPEGNKMSKQIILNKVYVPKKHSNPSKPKIESKVNEIIINQKLLPSPSEPINAQYPQNPKQDSSMIASKSEQGLSAQKVPYLQRESSKKENSDVFSKTDEIIQRVKLHKNEDILIEQQSDQSSHKNHKQSQSKPIYEHDPYATVRDSMESQANPQKRRRNRIFDGSSAKNKSKQGNITPEKGVQTQRVINDNASRQEPARQYDYYPQIKALNVLNKIVDQINPSLPRASRRNIELQQTFFDSLVSSTEELEGTIRAFNNITVIEKVQDQTLVCARKQAKENIKETRAKIAKFMSIRIDDQLTQTQQRTLRKFEQLSSTFEVINGVIQSFIDTKYRLGHLMQSTKGFMVNLKRGELKKIYCTLRQMGIEIETLKSIRASCGELRLERIFREYLQGEIRPLSELQKEMRERVGNMGPIFKI